MQQSNIQAAYIVQAIRTATMMHGLKRSGGKYGMVTMCIGMGMGFAMIVEAI